MDNYKRSKRCAVIVFILVMYVCCTRANNCCTRVNYTENTEQALHVRLFENYNADVIPNKDKSTPVNVTIGLNLTSIDNVDEKKQSMTIRATLEISWKDEYLMWDENKYVGVKRINVKNENIWLPDIALKYTFEKNTDLGQAEGRATITSDGVVTIYPSKLYTVTCTIHITKFPFDKQKCTYIFVPWTNPSERISLKGKKDMPKLSDIRESGEWKVLRVDTAEEQRWSGNSTYDYVDYNIKLQRKALYHVMNMIIPVMCISLLNVANFLLPSHGGERVTLSISIFLALALFLTIVNNSLPESSDEVSALSVYVGLQLFGSTIAVLMTVMSLTLFHNDEQKPVPKPLKLFVRICCARKLRQYDHADGKNPHVCSGEEMPAQDKCDGAEKHATCGCYGAVVKSQHVVVTWRKVSEAMDRFCLVTSLLWHTLLTACLMLSVML